MKNMKKILALVLALSMILSTSVISFAAEMTAAQKAETIGILEGEGDGVTAEYLTKTPTRLQAAIISLRLRGLEDEARAYEGVETFSDQDNIMWAGGRAIASYLKANPGLGWIGTDGKLMPNEPITAQAYVKVMLESLGFVQGTDFEWSEVFTFAAKKGLTGLTVATTMTNNGLAVGSVEALAATTKDGEMLIDKLVEDGAIREANAVAAGLVAETPDALAVVSVEALNLVQVEVVFNMKVDSDTAEEINNYDVDDQDIVLAELQDDEKTVILYMDTTGTIIDQQDKYDITVEDVEDLDENALDEIVFEDVEFFDNEAPRVLDAEIVGVNTVKVTFSEPVAEEDGGSLKSTFKVVDEDDDKVYIKATTDYVNDSKTEVYVILSSDLDTKDSITISVNTDMEDYAGFGVRTNSTTLVVDVDDTKPEVIGYKDTSANSVTLIFDGDIELLGSSYDKDDFYHTNSKNTVKATGGVEVENGDELVLTFEDDYELPQGSAYIYINDEVLADLWENENDDIRVKIEVDIDEEKPVVEKIELDDQDTIIITFSEDVDEVDRSDFTVYDEDDDTVRIASVSVKDDEVTVNFREDLNGVYAITIEDLEDIAGNEISATTLTFDADDETRPNLNDTDVTVTLYSAGTEDQMIKVFYNEKMDVSTAYSVALEANYAILDGTKTIDLSDMDDIDIDVVDDGEGVEIYIPYDSSDDDNENPHLSNTDDLIIGRVADAAGNYSLALSTTIQLGASTEVTIASAEMTAADTIEVTLSAKLSEYIDDDLVISIVADNSGDNLWLDFDKTSTDTINNTFISGVDLEEDDDGNTVVVITLDDEIISGGWAATVKTSVSGSGDRSETVYGVKLISGSGTTGIADSIAPMVALDSDEDAEVYAYDKDFNGQLDTIVIEYQEKIESSYMNKHIYDVADIDVDAIYVSDEGSASAAIGDSTPNDGRFVVIELDTDDEDLYDNDTESTLLVEQVASIFDTAGNEQVAGDTDVLETKDATGPVVLSAVKTSSNTIAVTLSEDVVSNKRIGSAANGWVVTIDNGTPDTVTNVAISGNQVTLTVADVLSGVVVATYTTQANTNEDSEGNELLDGSANLTTTVIDTTSPTYAVVGNSINAAGDTIVLTFNEPMNVATLTTSTGITSITGTTSGAFDLVNEAGTWSVGNTVYTITLDEATDVDYLVDNEAVAVILAATVTDVAGNGVSTATVNSGTVTAEIVAPTYTVVGTTVVGTGDTIVLTFNEPMNTATLSATTGITSIEGTTPGTLTLANDTGIWTGNTVYTITLNEATDTDYLTTGETIDVVLVNTVTDLAGNAVSISPVTSTPVTGDGAVLSFDSVTVADTDANGKIEYTFTMSAAILDTSVAAADFGLTGGTVTTGSTANDDTFTIESNVVDTSEMTVIYNATSGLEDLVGNVAVGATVTAASDTVAPVLMTAVLATGGTDALWEDGEVVTLTFSEDVTLSGETVLFVSYMTFVNVSFGGGADASDLGATSTAVTGTGSTIILTATGNATTELVDTVNTLAATVSIVDGSGTQANTTAVTITN